MAQTWTPPSATTLLSQAVETDIPAMLEALRTLHSGTAAPSSTVAYMLWADTTLGLLKIRNSANSAWIVVAPIAKDWATLALPHQLGALSATRTFRIASCLNAAKVSRVTLITDTTTVSSVAATTEWQFALKNQTTGNQLFSGTVGTGTSLGGVGGGEITANATYILLPDQNTSLAANDVVWFTLTKVGSPTNLGDAMLILDLTLST